MNPYTATFVAYGITAVVATAGLVGVLALDGNVALSGRDLRAAGGQLWSVFLVTVFITFIPWVVWRHLQTIEELPKCAMPVGALVGVALSDLYLIAMSVMGLDNSVDSQLAFIGGATLVGGACGPIYVYLERHLRGSDMG